MLWLLSSSSSTSSGSLVVRSVRCELVDTTLEMDGERGERGERGELLFGVWELDEISGIYYSTNVRLLETKEAYGDSEAARDLWRSWAVFCSMT